MNYLEISKCNLLNGDGIRVVLWVSGCSHHCKGCQNAYSWDCRAGIPFDDAAREELFEALEPDYISGVTFSGGDPLFEKNRETVAALIREIKQRFPEKTIWLYTGYTYEEILAFDAIRPVLDDIDVIVDGEFVEALRDDAYPWAGSTNQRVLTREMRKAL